MSSYVWDPASCVYTSSGSSLNIHHWTGGDTGNLNTGSAAIFTWITKAEINKIAHSINGNRGQRGKGITLAYWNKGPSLLTNKQDDLETIIADHRPHILGLGEANFRHDQHIEDVNIPGYNLHLDSGLDNDQVGGIARVAVYTHNLLRVKRRHDLEDDMVAAVWLECGLPRQKGILVCVGYRQWRLLGQQDNSSSSVPQQLARWTKFLDNWETALSEDKEVIVMLDANLEKHRWTTRAPQQCSP